MRSILIALLAFSSLVVASPGKSKGGGSTKKKPTSPSPPSTNNTPESPDSNNTTPAPATGGKPKSKNDKTKSKTPESPAPETPGTSDSPATSDDPPKVTVSVGGSGSDGPIGFASMNGGTTGGAGGKAVTVTSLDELSTAVKADGPAIITIKGSLTGPGAVNITNDKTVQGDGTTTLHNIALQAFNAKNIIIRNIVIQKVERGSGDGDAVRLVRATNVWVDHMDLSSDQQHGKDYYDGLCDSTHAVDFVTISNTFFHDHEKCSLIGHSDKNGAEDTGHLRLTYHNNHWENCNSRQPSLRFGTGHMFNNYHKGGSTGINTRMGAQVLVESCVFEGISEPIESKDSAETGYAVTNDVKFLTGQVTAPKGTFVKAPYQYDLLGSEKVQAAVVGLAGATLKLNIGSDG